MQDQSVQALYQQRASDRMTKPNYYSGKKKNKANFFEIFIRFFFTEKDEEPEPVDWKKAACKTPRDCEKCSKD